MHSEQKKQEVKKKFLTIREFISTSSAICKSPKNAETPSGSQRQHRFFIVIVKCEMPKHSYLRMVLQVALPAAVRDLACRVWRIP
jgi:hypothetical protein